MHAEHSKSGRIDRNDCALKPPHNRAYTLLRKRCTFCFCNEQNVTEYELSDGATPSRDASLFVATTVASQRFNLVAISFSHFLSIHNNSTFPLNAHLLFSVRLSTCLQLTDAAVHKNRYRLLQFQPWRMTAWSFSYHCATTETMTAIAAI